MSFDRQAEYRTQLEHLIELAKLPGWKAYAWRMAKELDAEDSGLYHGMRRDLTAAFVGDGQACTPVSADPTPTRRP